MSPKPKARAAVSTDAAVKKTDGRRFTVASFRNRRKRRQVERGVARTKVTNVFVIMGRSILTIRANWEIFGGLLLVYACLNTLVIGGFSDQSQLSEVKKQLNETNGGQLSEVATGFSLFFALIGSGSGASGGASLAYQSVILLVVSLAFVWSLRQLAGNNKFRIRDALYNSTYPLVQTVLVLLMVSVHLIPALIGAFLLNIVLMNTVITVIWAQVLAGLACLLLLAWSAYLVSASLFAAYIVTLPGMLPLEALRTAKRLVRFRRAMVLRKILFLPASLLFVVILIMVPLAVLLTPVAAFIFYLITLAAVPVVHTYMYTLYRELIRE